MFDRPTPDPPRYRGAIWLAVNPGPQGPDGPWQKIVIDDEAKGFIPLLDLRGKEVKP